MKTHMNVSTALLFAGIFLLLLLNMAPAPATERPKVAPITELTLERGYCNGSCPAYKVTFRPDGSLLYEGREFVTRKGTFKFWGSAYSRQQYKRLAELADLIRFDQLKPSYKPVPTESDIPHTTVSLKRAGQRQTVDSCADQEPTPLWGYEMAFDAVLAEDLKALPWERIGKKLINPA